jgi:hypothetical protein
MRSSCMFVPSSRNASYAFVKRGSPVQIRQLAPSSSGWKSGGSKTETGECQWKLSVNRGERRALAPAAPPLAVYCFTARLRRFIGLVHDGRTKTMKIKKRYRLFLRGSIFYLEDTLARKQSSLGTDDRQAAERILHARNEAEKVTSINLQIAQAYLARTRIRSHTRMATGSCRAQCSSP